MNERNRWVLCLDQGGHASRALVIDQRGEIRAQAVCDIKTYQPTPDRVEHDPQELIASIRDVIARVADDLGEAVQYIDAAGLATQRSSIVCWDKVSGQALSPVISWADRRAAATLEQLASDQQEDIHRRTGLYPNAHFGFSKIRWCLENIPAVQHAHQQQRLIIGSLAAYILHQILTEQPIVVDVANAARTLLLNIESATWDEKLLQQFQIPRAILPAVVPTRYNYGTLACGVYTIPLQICTGDQSAALFANGWPKPDRIYLNVGTGAFIQQFSEITLPPTNLLKSLVYRAGQKSVFVTEGTVNGAARAIQEYAELFGFKDVPWPEWLTTADEPPIFLNGVSGLGSPFWRADFASEFIGAAQPQAKMVAVLESIVFLIQANLECLHGYQLIDVSGGLANINGFCQRLADLARYPVSRSGQTEATARGLAHLLGEVAPLTLNTVTLFQPNPNPALQRRYRSWREALSRRLSAST